MTALWLAEKWDCRQNLVICPKKAIPVWKQEIALMGLDVNQFEIVSFETFASIDLNSSSPGTWSLWMNPTVLRRERASKPKLSGAYLAELRNA